MTDIVERLRGRQGIIWKYDHAEPLGWYEFQIWMHQLLPTGWSIISVPSEWAHMTEAAARAKSRHYRA